MSLFFKRMRHVFHYVNPVRIWLLAMAILRIAKLRFFYDWGELNRNRWGKLVGTPEKKPTRVVKRIAVEPEKCVGCGICSLVCASTRHGVGQISRSRIQIYRLDYRGIDHPVVCQQCDQQYCISACPTGACSSEGVDPNVCIACKMCAMACPYGAVFFDPVLKCAMKCDLCSGEPQCVTLCPTQAICFRSGIEISLPTSVIHELDRSRLKMLSGG